MIDLPKSVTVSVSVAVSKSEVFFVKLGVIVSGQYYLDVWHKCQLLFKTSQTTKLYFSKIVQTAHYARNTVRLLQCEIRNFFFPELQHPTAQS